VDSISQPVSSPPLRCISLINHIFRSELIEASTIKVIIKAGHRVGGVSIRKLEAPAEFSVQEAMEAFWNSENSISCTLKPQGVPFR
jgi:hypothetical protein